MRLRLHLLAASFAALALAASCQTTAPAAAPAAHPLVGKPLALRAADLRAAGELDVASSRGQVVIVDFWASWCAPCRLSLPFYEELYRARAKEGLQVLGVSIDVERALAERFLGEVPTTFPMAWDAGQAFAAALQLDTMPTAIVLDRAGTVRAVHRGFVSGDRAGIEALVASLLAEPAPSSPP